MLATKLMNYIAVSDHHPLEADLWKSVQETFGDSIVTNELALSEDKRIVVLFTYFDDGSSFIIHVNKNNKSYGFSTEEKRVEGFSILYSYAKYLNLKFQDEETEKIAKICHEAMPSEIELRVTH